MFSDWDSARQQADKLEKLGVGLLVLTDPDYPQGLYDTYNPPPYLYIAGSFAPEDKRAIAVVGTRTPDAYGKKITEQLTAELVRHGFTIVSGFARGIDTIAHKACLKAGGRTIAVLGSGIDLVYPPENGKLYKDIAQNGALVSEFRFGTEPDAGNFPKRNRIISALSLGVLVVQAAQKSGSLITAEFALEQNREVFAVPGNINTRLSAGANRLIKSGAKLVTDVDDILIEIDGITSGDRKRKDTKPVNPDELESTERLIYDILSTDQLHIDQIIKQSKLDSSVILAKLLSLEMKGVIIQQPGKYFQVIR